MKILVVDDFSTIRLKIVIALRQLNFCNIVEANRGVSALDLLKREKFDLVISGSMMSEEMSGLELVRAMRADDAMKDTPFLITMSDALNSSEFIFEAVKAGISNYIERPVVVAKLWSKINQIFARRK